MAKSKATKAKSSKAKAETPASTKPPKIKQPTKYAASGLTLKQEKFCQAYIESGNASDAYRRSYDVGSMTNKSIWEGASHLLAEAKVSARVKNLQEANAVKHEVTVESLVKELDYAREIAEREGQSGTLVAATMAKAKLLGLVVDRVESKQLQFVVATPQQAESTEAWLAAVEVKSLPNGSKDVD